MRTVTLELLRHGPPHNQLLSPLTRYLGLCGNHPAVTVEVPFKHSQFLTKLRALQYKETEKTRELQLEDTAEQMTSILASVPGLIAELAECCDGVEEKMTHLRLVLSANELALLPFELANAPNGFPGAGQSLALQSQMPLCITREGRRVSSKYKGWSDKPKILYVSASPSGAGPIPRDAHAYVLRQVIEPWVQYYDYRDEHERRERVGEHLTVLAGASVDDIQQACGSGKFTHVHILAHGIAYEKGEDQRFGLALHNARNPAEMDIVEGTRLAAALRTNIDGEDSGLSCPAVVTIASCESGQGGSVMGAGASIAHALHEAGIPLVVASQFPLTFSGSVLMAHVLYEGLLWGADPRRLLNGLRRQLKSRVPKSHDWASIVAYASFPADLDRELAKAKYEQAKRGIEAALNHADALSGRLSDRYQSGTGTGMRTAGALPPDEVLKALAEPRRKLNQAQRRLEEILDGSGADESRIAGLLASTQKRLSEILWRTANRSTDIKPDDKSNSEQDAREALEKSCEFYRRSFEADRTQSWGLVQSLALIAALQGSGNIKEDEWRLARLLSEQDLHLDSRERRAWAHGNLIELYLLALLMPVPPDGLLQAVAEQKAREHADLLLKEADPKSWEIHSTRRQMLRYLEFFNAVNTFDGVRWPLGLLEDLFGKLRTD